MTITQKIPSEFKALLKQKVKEIKGLWSGYGFKYAQTQDLEKFSLYPYKWSEIITTIKKRSGSPQVNENRIWNMQLSAQGIDGLILEPQQIFGFWNRVPRPIIANGFQSGPMLVGNRLTTDVGGGLCQISTTLFQALLWANLEIIERSNHSIDAHGQDRFFTLGQDATVAYGYKDLIAKNQTQIPLILRLQVLGKKSQVIASVWGQQPQPVTVKIASQILAEIPSETATGMSGWQVETIRYIQTADNSTETAIEHSKVESTFDSMINNNIINNNIINNNIINQDKNQGKNYDKINWQVNYRAIDIYKPHVQLSPSSSPSSP